MKKIFPIAALGLLLGGCAAIQLDPTATSVVVSNNKPAKSCHYVGQVVGNQGNFFTGGFTSNRNLEEGAMNDIRNQAGRMGANYVQLVNSRAGNTGSYNNGGGSMQQTNVTNIGNAYTCPALNQ